MNYNVYKTKVESLEAKLAQSESKITEFQRRSDSFAFKNIDLIDKNQKLFDDLQVVKAEARELKWKLSQSNYSQVCVPQLQNTSGSSTPYADAYFQSFQNLRPPRLPK